MREIKRGGKIPQKKRPGGNTKRPVPERIGTGLLTAPGAGGDSGTGAAKGAIVTRVTILCYLAASNVAQFLNVKIGNRFF